MLQFPTFPYSFFIPFGFGYHGSLSSQLLPYPGVEPLSSIVTLVFSYAADSDVCLDWCVWSFGCMGVASVTIRFHCLQLTFLRPWLDCSVALVHDECVQSYVNP